MTLRRSLIAIAGLGACGLLVAGCTGILEPLGGPGPVPDPPDAGPPANDGGDEPDNAAQSQFLNNVRDSLQTKCSGCHFEGSTTQPDFLAASADNYYVRIMFEYPHDLVDIEPAQSKILTVAQAIHYGQQWTPEEVTAITEWIEAEFVYRNDENGDGGGPIPDPPPPPGGDDDCVGITDAACALKRFGTCFSYDRWNERRVYEIADQLSSQGQCRGCHFDGKGGFWASNDPLDMYRKWKITPYVQTLVEAAIDNEGEFAGLIEAHRIEDKGSESGHPSYTLQSSAQAIDDYIRDTLDDYTAGNCVDDPGQ